MIYPSSFFFLFVLSIIGLFLTLTLFFFSPLVSIFQKLDFSVCAAFTWWMRVFFKKEKKTTHHLCCDVATSAFLFLNKYFRVFPFVCLFVYLFVCLFVCLFVLSAFLICFMFFFFSFFFHFCFFLPFFFFFLASFVQFTFTLGNSLVSFQF